jgi:hypothetical protein
MGAQAASRPSSRWGVTRTLPAQPDLSSPPCTRHGSRSGRRAALAAAGAPIRENDARPSFSADDWRRPLATRRSTAGGEHRSAPWVSAPGVLLYPVASLGAWQTTTPRPPNAGAHTADRVRSSSGACSTVKEARPSAGSWSRSGAPTLSAVVKVRTRPRLAWCARRQRASSYSSFSSLFRSGAHSCGLAGLPIAHAY